MKGKATIRLVFRPKSGWVGDAKSSSISYRELEILCLVGEGKTNKEIAEFLGLSYQTVKNRVYRMNKKLGARNSVQAMVMAWHAGMIHIEMKPDDWPFDDGKRIGDDPEKMNKWMESGRYLGSKNEE